MQRFHVSPFSALRALKTLQAASGLVAELLEQHAVGCLRQYSHASRPQSQQLRPSTLGQLCKKFQEHARRNNVQQAERLHQAYLEQDGEPKLWMVNTLIGVYARLREVDKAFALYEGLLNSPQGSGMEPNVFTYANLLNALAKAEHPPYDLGPEVAARAEALFGEMRARGVQPNQVAFHTLMDVQAKAAQPDAAFATYRAMLAAGFAPTVTSFAVLMAACGRAGDHRRAAEVMERLMPQAGVAPTTAIWNSLLGAYSKSGSVDGAYATWVRMLESGATPDAHTERALLDALASHPSLAADVVAEARQIRRSIAQQARLLGGAEDAWAQEASGGGPGVPGGAEEGEAGAGAQPPLRPSPMRQGELAVDHFKASRTTPMAGSALDAVRQLYGGGGARGSLPRPPAAAAARAVGDGLPDTPSAHPAQQQGLQQERGLGQRLQQQGEGELDLRQLLWLDLHGMSQAAARASLLRRLEMLVHSAQALLAQVQREQEDAAAQQAERALQAQQTWQQLLQQQRKGGISGGGSGRGGEDERGSDAAAQRQASLQQQPRQKRDWRRRQQPQQQPQQQAQQQPLAWPPQQRQQGVQPAGQPLPGAAAEPGGAASARRGPEQRHALVIVTGVGRHSKEAGAGVLRAAVEQLLEQHGIAFQEDPSNLGRVLVPWPGLRDFVAAQQEAMQTDHFFGAARARYTYIFAGVAGLMSAAYILPRLAPWMPTG